MVKIRSATENSPETVNWLEVDALFIQESDTTAMPKGRGLIAHDQPPFLKLYL